MDKNQYKVIKLVRNFDAIPAVTTGMPIMSGQNGPKRPGRRHGVPTLSIRRSTLAVLLGVLDHMIYLSFNDV